VKDLPRNTTWLLGKALGSFDPTADGAKEKTSALGNGLLDRARQAGGVVKDVLPAPGDSIEAKLQRARIAADQAQEAEDSAVHDAEAAKEKTAEARRVADRCKAYVRDIEKEQAEEVSRRVDEARREAEARIEEERVRARADADQRIADAKAEADDQVTRARQEAEEAQAQAKERLSEATRKLTEARRLAEEATQATKAAAEEAHRQAAQLAAEADRDARSADERVEEAERVRLRAADTAVQVTRQLKGTQTAVDLESLTKHDLLELAAAEDIQGRAGMTKAELVTALKRSSRAAS
jgi:hypothetical protein